MEAFLVEEYKGMTIKLYSDPDPMDPRDCDNLGKMICFHRRYLVGDKHNMTISELQEIVKRKDVIALPIYMYDHSGVTIQTTPFSCPWDSGQLGYIYVTHKDVKENFGIKRITQQYKDLTLGVLMAEVDATDKYLRGAYCGYVVENPRGETLDSLWGIDDQNYAMDQAKEFVDGIK